MPRIAKFSPIYGNNIGDIMISESIEYMLRQRGIEIVSYDLLLREPGSYWSRMFLDECRIMISSFLATRFSTVLKFLKAALFKARQDTNRYRTLSGRYDAIIVGGGNIIMDKMGSDYARRVREICVNAVCPVAVYAAGAGPLVKDRARLVDDIRGSATFVSMRDRQSRNLMGFDGVFLDFDPAFIISDIAPARRGGGYIGVNVIGSFFDDGEFEHFARDVAAFAARRGAKIRLIVTAYPDDSREARRFRSTIAAFSPEVYVEIAEVGVGTGELAEAYSDIEFFIGCRMHSLIFALSYGIPSVGCEWDPKVRGMFMMFFDDLFHDSMLYQPGCGVQDALYGTIDVPAVSESVKADVYRQFSRLLGEILVVAGGE